MMDDMIDEVRARALSEAQEARFQAAVARSKAASLAAENGRLRAALQKIINDFHDDSVPDIYAAIRGGEEALEPTENGTK